MKKVIVIVKDDALGVEDLPDGVEVEIRDYREKSVRAMVAEEYVSVAFPLLDLSGTLEIDRE